MKPEEKAKELIELFKKHSRIRSLGFLVPNQDMYLESAKECALIAVDEIIAENKSYYSLIDSRRQIFWQEVKEQINKKEQ